MTTTAQQLAVQAKLDGIVAKTRSDLSLLASRHGQARKESKQIAPMSCTDSQPNVTHSAWDKKNSSNERVFKNLSDYLFTYISC